VLVILIGKLLAKSQPLLWSLVFGLFCFGSFYGVQGVSAKELKGLEEVARLLQFHQPIVTNRFPKDVLEKKISLFLDSQPVLFSIPGFHSFGCGKCHKPENLIDHSVKRMKATILRMNRLLPNIGKIPLRQYILQTYASPLLQVSQFAHATFDTIRLFPRTIIVDSAIYDQETQFHEILHLTQPFVGHPNEMEAYGVNIRSDPRFLFINFPYFENVIRGFFEPTFGEMLKRFYGREFRSIKGIPEQVLQFSEPFEPKSLESTANGIKKMEPALKMSSKIIRHFPLESAYLSEQTGVRSLILDLAAVQTFELPKLENAGEMKNIAFNLLKQQFDKIDNTSLGYVIDRKSEALMTLKDQNKVHDGAERLALYFHFLKRRFVTKNGKIDLTPMNKDDFRSYVERKLKNISKMLEGEEITNIEKEGGMKVIAYIKKELQARKGNTWSSIINF
jgi:hypothetical protein